MQEGSRFSFLYLERGKPANDSDRFRTRLAVYFKESLNEYRNNIAPILGIELGVEVPYRTGYYDIPAFFKKAQIRDVLDSITVIFQYFIYKTEKTRGQSWLNFVARVMREENIGYRIDSKGGVHFFIDEEFERSRAAVIAGLSSVNHLAVLDAFEKSYGFLDQDVPDTANAITSIFEAVEILYKHIVQAGDKDRLNGYGVQSRLKPLLQKCYSDDTVVTTACNHILDGLCDWIEAGHMYRHGQRIEEPSSPPLDFAVLYLSQGASYIRFLLPLIQ